MKPNRVLVASYGVPQDDRDSGSRRVFDLIRFLRDSGWAVDFVAANGMGDLRAARILQQLGVAVHSEAPPSSSSADVATVSVVETLVGAANFDLALFAFWPVAGLYLPTLRRLSPATRVIVDSLDVHFLRLARGVLHSSGGPQPCLLDDGFGAYLVDELNTYVAADAVMTVSQKEAELLCDFSGGSLLTHTVPDCEDMQSSPLSLAERSGIVLLGSFQHQPNVDALEYLCGDILPRVDQSLLARHPVYVVGTGLNEDVRSIVAGVEHVKLVGWAPSVLPYFHRSRISAVPLRYGAGTKRKLIQALMTATPTVSTSIGTEGLDLHNGEHALVADDTDSFARGIERLLRDDELWNHLATTGRERVLRTHGRSAVREKFHQFINIVVEGPSKPEMLPPCSRDEYYARIGYRPQSAVKALDPRADSYARLIEQIRCTVQGAARPNSTVIVVSKGDESLLQLASHRGWHFPRSNSGAYAGHHPANSSDAINHLESLRDSGADYLVLPRTAFWWLEHYQDFAQHLDRKYQRIVDEPDSCIVYSLGESHRDGTPAKIVATGASQSVRADGTKVLPEEGLRQMVRLIAFYLPQFHPIPENDRWWGEGFTEWRNVAKAKPLFPGHRQPQLPADLGFYDLRLAETREQQARLARRHGIHGFCYYHYWFNGKRLLERPFNEVLQSGRPDFPFCLCWANEPWSRRWDGSETDVLQPQSYSAEDDLHHIRWLLSPLSDSRAISIDGRPVFLVYRADQLPDPARTTDLWRKEAERHGLKGLYLMAVETGWDAGWDATQSGFDAKVLFQPQFSMLSKVERVEVPNSRLRVYDYQQAWPVLADPDPVSYLRYDTVFPSWDNSARKGEDGWVVHNSTPKAYEDWLRLAIDRAMARPAEQRIVFINAWNEWAEGTHLEPDRTDGRGYLEATHRAVMPEARPYSC